MSLQAIRSLLRLSTKSFGGRRITSQCGYQLGNEGSIEAYQVSQNGLMQPIWPNFFSQSFLKRTNQAVVDATKGATQYQGRVPGSWAPGLAKKVYCRCKRGCQERSGEGSPVCVLLPLSDCIGTSCGSDDIDVQSARL